MAYDTSVAEIDRAFIVNLATEKETKARLSQLIATYPKDDEIKWANDIPTAGTHVRLKSAFMGEINGEVGTGEEESVKGIVVGWRTLLENEGMLSRIGVIWRAQDTSISGLSGAAILDESETTVYGFQSHEVRMPRPGGGGCVLFYVFFMPSNSLKKKYEIVSIKGYEEE